jgi:hypothetical protein
MPGSPESLVNYLNDIPDDYVEIKEGVRKAVQVAPLDPDMALTRVRKVLEHVIRDVFQRRCNEDPGTRPLENLLQRLVKDGHLPSRLDAYATTVRKLGNVGTHSFSDRVTEEDVYQSLAQLLPVLEWYTECECPISPPASCSARPGQKQSRGEAERLAPQRAPGLSALGTAGTENLLHLMWDYLDPNLQDAFSLAYNKKRRQGGNRISTRDFFQALARLGDASLCPLIESLPEGALPEPVAPDVPRDSQPVLEESPLLSDCVEQSLEHFRELEDLPRRISPADIFVDIAKHGHGPSVARLREHGVGEREIEEQVHRLGLSVLRRKRAELAP